MKSSILVLMLTLLCYGITLTMSSVRLSKTNCDPTCGNVVIPYPFGVGSKCSANSSFTVTCRNSNTPFLSITNMDLEILKISITGTVTVKQPRPSPMDCSTNLTKGHLLFSLKGSPFTISARYNTLAVLGCKNSVWLQANETTTVGGCTSMCAASSTETSCNGVNCCQTALPTRLKELEYKYKTNEAISDGSSCGFVLPVEKVWLREHYTSLKAPNRGLRFAPLVLEWEFGELKGYTNSNCTYADDYCLSYPDEFGSRYAESFSSACLHRHLEDECRAYPFMHICQSPSFSDLDSFNSNYEELNSFYYRGDDYASATK